MKNMKEFKQQCLQQHSIQIMTQNNAELHEILCSINYKDQLHQSLAMLQRLLDRKSISATSKIGLEAYEMVCQEYINMSKGKGNISKLILNAQTKSKGESQAKSTLDKEDNVLMADKEKALAKAIKKNWMIRFLKLAKLDQKEIKKQQSRVKKVLKVQTAKFHYKINIYNKFWRGLKVNYEDSMIQSQKAKVFLQQRQQITLQEYFLAWKEESLMTAAQREFRQLIEQKYQYCAKFLFFKRLKISKDKKEEQLIKNEGLREQLIRKIAHVSASSFFQRLKNNVKRQQNLELKKQHISKLRKRHLFQDFMKTNNKFKIYRNIKEQNRQNFITRTLYSKIFFRKLVSNLQIRKGYFKDKEKIIFITFLFEGIAQSLKRKGYEYNWMNEMNPSLQFIDSKLQFQYRTFRLRKIFNGFKRQIREQEQKIEEIMLMRSGQILKQIIYNFKLSIVKQKEEHKIEAIETLQRNVSARKVIDAFTKIGSLHKKENILSSFITYGRVKHSINYLKQYYRSSKYYSTKLTEFLEKKHYKELYLIFSSIKTVLITERVNNRIVEEYRNYANHQKTQQIFQCLRQYTFNEQLIKKRQRNVMRIRLREYADRFFYNLKIDLYAGMKERYNKLRENQKKVQDFRRREAISIMFSQYKDERITSAIEEKIGQEYQLRFQWKFFNLLKIITQRQRLQRKNAKKIQQKRKRRVKEKAFDSFVSNFLLSLLLKKIDQNLSRKMKEYGFNQLKKIQFCRNNATNLSEIQEIEEYSSALQAS